MALVLTMCPQAFLSRAVRQLSESCQQQGLQESVVAKKLRTRGIDLAQLQERAAEVQRGVAECASDEGWKLIQVLHWCQHHWQWVARTALHLPQQQLCCRALPAFAHLLVHVSSAQSNSYMLV